MERVKEPIAFSRRDAGLEAQRLPLEHQAAQREDVLHVDVHARIVDIGEFVDAQFAFPRAQKPISQLCASTPLD